MSACLRCDDQEREGTQMDGSFDHALHGCVVRVAEVLLGLRASLALRIDALNNAP
jgi:hypothetical protein